MPGSKAGRWLLEYRRRKLSQLRRPTFVALIAIFCPGASIKKGTRQIAQECQAPPDRFEKICKGRRSLIRARQEDGEIVRRLGTRIDEKKQADAGVADRLALYTRVDLDLLYEPSSEQKGAWNREAAQLGESDAARVSAVEQVPPPRPCAASPHLQIVAVMPGMCILQPVLDGTSGTVTFERDRVARCTWNQTRAASS